MKDLIIAALLIVILLQWYKLYLCMGFYRAQKKLNYWNKRDKELDQIIMEIKMMQKN